MIAGEARGHRLKTLKGSSTRPTADRVKEALFNILAPYVEGGEVLDLFAGTGSLGIEALSRGAASAVFVDKSGEACSLIHENLIHTKLQGKSSVLTMDFASALARFSRDGRKFDLILLDPPYNKNFIQETLKILTNNDIIRDDGILAVEHHATDRLPEREGGLLAVSGHKYGETVLTVYKRIGDTPAEIRV